MLGPLCKPLLVMELPNKRLLLLTFYSIRPASFHIIQKNVNLATSLYFGVESEFIIAAQTFSSLRIAKCGLELTITSPVYPQKRVYA